MKNDEGKRYKTFCCSKPSERPFGAISQRSMLWQNGSKIRGKCGGVANTISSVCKDNYLVLPAVLKAQRTDYGRAIRKQYDNHEVSLKRQDIREWVPRKDGISNTISTVTKDNIVMTQNKTCKHGIPAEMLHLDNMPAELNGKKVYIRKFTPRECFRLMDVSEEDIDKMILPVDDKGKPVISNSQLYKLAGNSIVVNVMTQMFRRLPFVKDPSMQPGAPVQLSLFD